MLNVHFTFNKKGPCRSLQEHKMSDHVARTSTGAVWGPFVNYVSIILPIFDQVSNPKLTCLLNSCSNWKYFKNSHRKNFLPLCWLLIELCLKLAQPFRLKTVWWALSWFLDHFGELSFFQHLRREKKQQIHLKIIYEINIQMSKIGTLRWSKVTILIMYSSQVSYN